MVSAVRSRRARQKVYVRDRGCEMRTIVLALAAVGLLMAQAPPAPLVQFLMGRLTEESGDRIEVQDSAGAHVLYSHAPSHISPGNGYHEYALLCPAHQL